MFDQIETNTKYEKGRMRQLVQKSKLPREIKDSKGFIMRKGLGLVEGWKIEFLTNVIYFGKYSV